MFYLNEFYTHREQYFYGCAGDLNPNKFSLKITFSVTSFDVINQIKARASDFTIVSRTRSG